MPSDYSRKAKIIEIFFKKLFNEEVSNQIDLILQKGFDEENNKEIIGSVLSKDAKLELKIIESEDVSKVEEALSCFEVRDYSGNERLYNFLKESWNAQKDQDLKYYRVFSLYKFFQNNKDEIDFLDSLSESDINLVTESYKDFLKKYSSVSLGELINDDKIFLGMFHLHKSGRGPSDLDISESISNGIPYLIISAKEDYKENNVNVYLLFEGDSKLVYKGPLIN